MRYSQSGLESRLIVAVAFAFGEVRKALLRLVQLFWSREAPKFEGLKPGMVFEFKGFRSAPFYRRNSHAGIIIDLERSDGIVHVMVLRPKNKEEEAEADILHIPMLYSAWKDSLPQVLHESPPPKADIFLRPWREARELGQAGAFNIPLHEVTATAWMIALENKPEGVDPLDYVIITAFPKPGADGGYKVMEVQMESLRGRNRREKII